MTHLFAQVIVGNIIVRFPICFEDLYFCHAVLCCWWSMPFALRLESNIISSGFLIV